MKAKGGDSVRTILPSEAEKFRYRWVVLVCSFLVRALVFGTVMSVGVLYVEWLEDFQTGMGETALIGSIATGSALLMGPASSALLHRFTCRQVIVASGILMSFGLVCSSFSNGIPYLCISFGIVTGCSGGIANLASIVSLSQYFDKQRPLAMGVGSSGTGVGIFAFGLMQKRFVEMYTWRGSLLLLGGIQLNLIVCGLLMVGPAELRHHTSLWNWRSKPHNLVADNRDDNYDERPIVKKNNKRVSIQVQDLTDRSSQSRAVDEHNDHDICEQANQTGRKRRRSTLQMIKAKMKLTEKTINLWKDPIFLILFTSDFCSWMVQFVPYVHIPERAAMLGIEHGALLISVMGITSAIGKVAFGALCTFCRLSAFKVFLVAQTLFGLSTVLSPLCVNFWSLCLFAVSFGFLSGNYGLMMVVPAQLLGEEKFSLAYGFMLAGEGVGVYLGPPLVGWITDASKSYNSSFYLAGCILLLSAILLMVRPLLTMLERRKRKIRHRQAW